MPGVGRKLAEKLLLKYGSPGRVLGLSAGELSMTGGIGWKKAEKIRRVMDTKYSKKEEPRVQSRLEL
jgi:ERCC4-type nuclease